MPTTIKLKNSVTTTNVPSSLAQGEVAINVTDKKVWVGNAATTPVQLLGTGSDGTFTNLTVTNNATFDTTTLVVDATNNRVGVGTASPQALLNIADATTATARLTSIGNANLDLSCSATTATIGSPNGIALLFNTSNTERVRITSAGFVGIGTSSPSVILDVSGTAITNRIRNTGTTGQTDFAATNTGGTLFVGLDTSGGAATGTAYASYIYSTAATPLLFYTNSTLRATITSAGSVGIGTSSPNARLNVVGTGANPTVEIAGNSAIAGVSSPAFLRLSNPHNSIGAGDSIGEIQFYSADASGGGVGVTSFVKGIQEVTSPNNGALTFGTGSTTASERMRLDSSGNLGLGVTPSAWGSGYKAIQIGDQGSLSYSANDLVVGTNAYRDATNWKYLTSRYAPVYTINSGTGSHAWYTTLSGTAGNAISFTQAMTLDASGNLGVGTTSPNGRLDIAAAQDGNLLALSDNSAIRWSYYLSSNALRLYNYATSSDAMTIDASGNLLVGKTVADLSSDGHWLSPLGYSYHTIAAGANTLHVYSSTASAYRFYVSAAGVINATTTTITAISDQRLKENIRDLDDGLEKVMELKPRKFDWKEGKGEDTKNARGFIAQELEIVFPDMVTAWIDPAPEGEEPYKAVNANLIPTLVKAIQEQQAIINDLKARIETLESK